MLLEHVSLTVADLDAETAFLRTAFPDFRVRGGGETAETRWTQHWLHVGNDDQYLALYQARPDAGPPPQAHTTTPSANHIGVVVDDVESLAARLQAAGYREGHVAPPHPHRKRVYVIDPAGFEWEFVEYLSDKPEERNAY